MLSVAKYSKEHTEQARERIERSAAAFSDLERAADGKLGDAVSKLEAEFFNNLVLALDHFFLHRARTLEGKDGNPLNEMRVVCNSLTDNGGRMMADKTIRMKPADSVLGYEVGDEISITAADFDRLAAGFFAEIERRYAEPAA